MTRKEKVMKAVPDATPYMGMCGWSIHSPSKGFLAIGYQTLTQAWSRAAKNLPNILREDASSLPTR